ncbi:TetR/AcrR family transcriptional regulator [Clostridium estertheticum]|nr:TetR/AcrR family transcriptional regulator [Clostridium estertheticum]WLC77109.1 TetR/AcrR family transcriptional regulator [Clostridium estertheticum]
MITYKELVLVTEDKKLYSYLFDETLPEEEISKRQWDILDAATKIFSEKGFEGGRTSDIAKEANISEGTIFRYFKTKKDLLVGLLMPLIVKFFRPLMFKSMEKIMDNKKDESINVVLKNMMMDRMALIKRNGPLVKTVMIESFYHPELLEPLQKEIAPKLMPIVDNFFKSNIEKGNLREIEPRLMTRSLISLLAGYSILSNLLPEVFTTDGDEKDIEKIVDILINGIGVKRSEE